MLPPRAGPRLGDGLDGLRLEAVGGIPGDGVDAPEHLAVVSVIRRDVAAHAEIGAAVADEHLALHDPRRACDRVVLGLIDGQGLPHLVTALRFERDEPAVEGAHVHLARPHRHAAIDDVAAAFRAVRAGHLRIELPQDLAGLRVERQHVAPGTGRVDDAIDHDRRRLHAARAPSLDVVRPRETQLADVGRGDSRERAEALLRPRATRRGKPP